MKTVQIRQLKPSEWQLYKKVQLEALKEDPQAFASSYEKWVSFTDEKWKERPSNKNSLLFVAMDEATPVGLVGVHLSPDKNEKIPDVWGMYVNSNYRRMGLGKKLMEKAQEVVQKTWSVKEMGLMVNSDQDSAVKFYEKLGFKRVGTQDYVLGDGKNHMLFIMKKEL